MILFEITEVMTPAKGKCLIGSALEPESLEISGADVTGLPDDYVIAAGSELVCPANTYKAFEDGVFTKMGPAEPEV